MSLITLIAFITFLYTGFWLLISQDKSRNEDWKRVISAVQKGKKEEEDGSEDQKNDKKQEGFVISELPWIISTEYAKYDFLDYSVRELSYPEEKTRYYAVVTMTGGEFNKNKVNAIIQFKGDRKDYILNYGLIPAEYFKHDVLISGVKKTIWTFDEVKRRLNTYIKDKLNGTDNTSNENWKAYYSCYACYFDTMEDATFALCAFKQVVDERLRKKSLSINDVSENVINVKFED